ncbi:hypothetical protein [Clostridium baratii]|uniref:hypothetical protein n=1 Tax=Clostridium baratii TaxID=1561 RepID=UPI003D7B0E73
MNLLNKYIPHEKMEMTIRDIRRKQLKREKELNSYQLMVSDNIKKRCKIRRKSSGC